MTICENGKVRKATEEELKLIQEELPIEYQIMELKENLNSSDYKAIKYAERAISAIISAFSKLGINLVEDEEYIAQKAQRERWRAEINKLEEEAKK